MGQGWRRRQKFLDLRKGVGSPAPFWKEWKHFVDGIISPLVVSRRVRIRSTAEGIPFSNFYLRRRATAATIHIINTKTSPATARVVIHRRADLIDSGRQYPWLATSLRSLSSADSGVR